MSDTAVKTSVLQALIEKKKAAELEQQQQRGEKRGRDVLEDDILDDDGVERGEVAGQGDDAGRVQRGEDGEAFVGDKGVVGRVEGDEDNIVAPSPPAMDEGEKNDFVDPEGEGDLVLREEDKDFIDDEGVADDQRVDFADDADAPTQAEAEEAEDADDLSKLFDKSRRDSMSDNHAELSRQAENLMAQMEAALDADREAFDHKQPALHKLRMLKKAQDAFSIQRLHDHLLRGGVLGVLKGWLEPMPDGSMPNSKVRSGVLQMLVSLNMNTHDEEQKEWLKRSGVGKLVMLLTKLPEETQENRRVARGLVEAWSRPILGEGNALNEVQQAREAEVLAKARRRDGVRAGGEGDVGGGNLEKRNAVIPQAAELDYTIKPKSKVDASLMNQGRGSTKMPKLLKKLAKKKSAGK